MPEMILSDKPQRVDRIFVIPDRHPLFQRLIKNWPGETDGLPPTGETSNGSGNSSNPAPNSSKHSTPRRVGTAKDRRPYRGVPPMAALSLRFTAKNFLTSIFGEISERSKWIPSMGRSTVATTLFPGVRDKMAASSPMPRRTLSVLAAKRFFIRPMRPNSSISLTSTRLSAQMGHTGKERETLSVRPFFSPGS
jgi:hypothetical protein